MEANTSFDAFKLCWDVINQESAYCDNTFFNAEHCKIIDSRDSNFKVVENRLAYAYKYGCFNILLFEECFLTYINQCTETLFPFDNLKVCSLSNGSGFDIIGLLRALSISNKRLKGLPVFNAINLHESWLGLYKLLVFKAYETFTYTDKSFADCFHLSQTNINLIQGDIYSTLSPEMKDYISNSNVLLMVNVFVSSKATPTIFETSLKEIFTLLNPGSLIFFIGSKNNLKLFSKLADLKRFVKCVFGPQKVTLKNLPIDEQITNIVGVKPSDSGQANFIVWQKRNQILNSLDCEQESTENYAAVQYKDNSDTMSDICPSESSIASSIENVGRLKHDLLSDKFKSGQINSKMTSPTISLHQSLNSVEHVTSVLNGIQLNPNNCEKTKMKQSILPPHFNNACKIKDMLLENGVSIVQEHKITKDMKKNRGSQTNPMTDLAANLIVNNPSNNLTANGAKIISHNISDKEGMDKAQSKSIPKHLSLNPADNCVQLLLQRCDSLISKLEELTIDIKNDLNSSRKCQVVNKTHFYNHRTENCSTIHHCCCVKIMHSCCRNFCR